MLMMAIRPNVLSFYYSIVMLLQRCSLTLFVIQLVYYTTHYFKGEQDEEARKVLATDAFAVDQQQVSWLLEQH